MTPELPDSWHAFTKPRPEEPVALNFEVRAQDFIKRITALSADLATRGRTRTLALQKLHRICQAEVRTLKARYTLATVKLALSSTGERDPRRGPRSLSLAPKKDAVSASAISRSNRKKPARWNAAYHERIHHDQSNLIPLGSRGLHPNGSRTPRQRPLPPKRHGPHGPHRAQDAEIFFSATFSLPQKKLPYPALLVQTSEAFIDLAAIRLLRGH
jgi:hypothetical protein